MTTTPGARPRDLLGLLTGGEGAITGTVVCAAVIAYAGPYADSAARLTATIIGTVAVYWLAHLHALTIGTALARRKHPLAALRHALVATLPIAAASLLPVGALLITSALGADLSTAAWIALGSTIVLLTAYSYVAGARGGLDTRGRIACAIAGAVLGGVVALLKVSLH